MAENRLTDLNNALFKELNRLDQCDIKSDEMQQEITRAKAITDVGNTIINNANTVIKATETYSEWTNANVKLPQMIGIEDNGKKQ